MDDVTTYRARACDLRARARACETAAEAAGYIELAVAWEALADQAAAPEPVRDAAEG